jgi:collagenase-like PrtC family protease
VPIPLTPSPPRPPKQDVGAVALIRRVAPALHIHGSTQMSITSAEGAEFAGRLGVDRVVVGRELSIRCASC